ncbi:hypothetical protein QYF61_018687 [Mycteria americana]|uniref:Membrane insertase YidC/Oxa/ALB C-terminal domain-containing protein n=1 Tax=Mycteria americana TaxID=33587 RepID=A0AAN7NXH1_MYCAM|nr:hypothetical protein QYF61_018687 [Mycteria americana]
MWRLARACARGWGPGRAAPAGARSGPLTVAAAAAAGGPGGWYEWLAQSAPVHGAEAGLVALQAAAGLPWWAAIACGAAVLRTAVTLPLAAHQSRLLAKVGSGRRPRLLRAARGGRPGAERPRSRRILGGASQLPALRGELESGGSLFFTCVKLENLQPEIKKLAERLRYEVSVRGKQLGWSEKVARFHFKKNLRRIMTELYIRDNCHPFKATLLVWVQIPMWVCVSLALRNCSVGATDSEVQEQFSAGGALWFTDLTAPDSTWILPVLLGLVNLLIVEIFASQKMEVSRFQKLATNFFRVVSVVMIPVAATVPSSMALYWLSSSFMGLLHNLLLRSPTFRRLCCIPRTKNDSDTPYRDIVSALTTKYGFKK